MGSVLLSLLLACAGAPPRGDDDRSGRPSPSGRTRHGASDDPGCSADEDCEGLERCFAPDVPVCGGADRQPLAECPPARPFRVRVGCREECEADAPPSCRDGFECRFGGVCRPHAQDADQNGCAHLPCARSLDCEGGTCVQGRCYDQGGRCEEMPSSPEVGSGARQPQCPDGTVTVESCITGGMAIQTPEGPRANRTCTTQCLAAAPAGSLAMRCAEVEPDHFRCEGFAP